MLYKKLSLSFEIAINLLHAILSLNVRILNLRNDTMCYEYL